MMLVMRQLSAVLDHQLLKVTRRVRLTPHEALVLAWLVEKPGLPAFTIAWYLGRSRQNVQRSLERLEDRELVERYSSLVRDCTAGWGLTERGRTLFAELEHGFHLQDQELERKGVRLRDWVNSLNELLVATRRPEPCGMSNLGLIDGAKQRSPRLGSLRAGRGCPSHGEHPRVSRENGGCSAFEADPGRHLVT